MPEIAADDPGTTAELEAYRAAGAAWVAVDGDGPIAYLLTAEVDGCMHIEQVSVDPAHRRPRDRRRPDRPRRRRGPRGGANGRAS